MRTAALQAIGQKSLDKESEQRMGTQKRAGATIRTQWNQGEDIAGVGGIALPKVQSRTFACEDEAK